MEFLITKQWDGSETGHDNISITLSKAEKGLKMVVKAPLFNDPAPPDGKSGETFQQLWDYEVVEAFFLGKKEKYLEVELCPHGQHLVLLLNGTRKSFKDKLPLQYESKIKGDHWQGEAIIPFEYFPPELVEFNAYAIHGSGENRMYEALYPAPHGKHLEPDFHRLEHFQAIDLKDLLLCEGSGMKSELWDQE